MLETQIKNNFSIFCSFPSSFLDPAILSQFETILQFLKWVRHRLWIHSSQTEPGQLHRERGDWTPRDGHPHPMFCVSASQSSVCTQIIHTWLKCKFWPRFLSLGWGLGFQMSNKLSGDEASWPWGHMSSSKDLTLITPPYSWMLITSEDP